MELIPDWAPNIHPMIVHFPIALVIAAIGADLLSLLVRRWDWLRPATVALYLVAGASAVVTYFTGTWAADAVSVPAEVQSVLTEHSDLGWWTMWFFGVYALMRHGVHVWSGTRDHAVLHVVLFLIALGGGYLLYETGEHGAQMVYRYGVGVTQPDTTQMTAEPGLTVGEAGWQWQPQSDTAWTARMKWLEGSPSVMQTSLDTMSTGAVALRLRPTAPVTFVVSDTLGAVQVTAEINLNAFDGGVQLLHHVQGAQTYDVLAIKEDSLRLGRMADDDWKSFGTGSGDISGWTRVRVVGDGTHFRGYIGDQLVVHGHGEAAPPGVVGLRLNGTGTVRLRRLAAESL